MNQIFKSFFIYFFSSKIKYYFKPYFQFKIEIKTVFCLQYG